MQILDWKTLAEKIKDNVRSEIRDNNLSLCLAIVIVWNNPASEIYVKKKIESCEGVWIKTIKISYENSISQQELIKKIHELNEDNHITWIIIQLPLPEQIFLPSIIKAINPKKDVDWFTAYNVWKMFASPEFEELPPATPAWIIRLLNEYNIEIKWKNIVVIWHSNIVGKPISTMLINRNATVTTCHIYTKDLTYYTKNADILISATWVKNLIKREMIKEWVIIIDVWINRDENWKISWDVDFENVAPLCSYITPVPWWVWPMTIAQILLNVLNAYRKQTE